ncbi:pyrimidine reductase family protein [Gordonia zhaorongruii]|uniref:pyrimidine reductase family protein n=1 Tax=Gordonia zhaorongruii TaxID=2597659 RepID=UPI0010484D31|nr:pyrimidine reductase family protein [Gordonia zhaorongruii]
MSSGVGPDCSGAEFDSVAVAERSYADWDAGVRTNMVMGLDGSASFHGRVGPLSSPADRDLFHALRALADVVLVGASTARAENYGPVKFSESIAALRSRTRPGLAPVPRLAIVTASCRLPHRCLNLPPEQRPFVITSGGADTSSVDGHAEIIVAGADEVDLSTAVAELRSLGLHRIHCEGGPTLLDGLTEADLLDELCITLTPQLTAEPVGSSGGTSALAAPRTFRRKHAIAHDDDLFLRYIR